MTGISVTIGLRDTDTQNQLQLLLDRMDRRQPFFAAVGERILGGSKDSFAKEEDAEGRKWQALKPGTIRQRMANGQVPITILRSNTRGKIGSSLAGSVNYEASDDEARVGSPVASAAIHQLGGTIKKPSRAGKIFRKRGEDGQLGRRFAKKSAADEVTDVTIPDHTITIPARPFIGVSRATEEGIFEDAETWLGL